MALSTYDYVVLEHICYNFKKELKQWLLEHHEDISPEDLERIFKNLGVIHGNIENFYYAVF